MGVPGHEPLNYLLRLRPQGASYVIDEETLSQQRRRVPPPFKHIESFGPDIRYFEVEQERLLRPTWEHNPLETSLSQVPKMFQGPEDFRRRLASSTFYHVLNVEPRSSVRLPQPMRPASLPGKDGEDLVSCLFYLREADRDRFEAIEDSLRAAFPAFERLDFPPVAAGTLAMTWRDKNLSKPLYMHQLSEGMLRFLWLATLLGSPGLTALTLLDEPEVSLHPELLSLLAGLLREAANRTQLVVATHSDRLVRFLKPAEVVVIDSLDDGMARLTWADRMDLDGWLTEYTLDEVWRMGRMGGRA
jgi:predicted ATPase